MATLSAFQFEAGCRFVQANARYASLPGCSWTWIPGRFSEGYLECSFRAQERLPGLVEEAAQRQVGSAAADSTQNDDDGDVIDDDDMIHELAGGDLVDHASMHDPLSVSTPPNPPPLSDDPQGPLHTPPSPTGNLMMRYHICYSRSYTVPVLFFAVSREDGSLLTESEVRASVLGDARCPPQSNRMFLTELEHPALGTAWMCLHPCGTADLMEMALSGKPPTESSDRPGGDERAVGVSPSLLDTDRAIGMFFTLWLSLVSPLVGFPVQDLPGLS